MKLAAAIERVLGRGGVLAAALPSYEWRPGQLEMALAVGDALMNRRPLLVEAGTGTGKTLAYLVPAILSGQKVVISTGTKNLQEQIFLKDVPLLQRELDQPFSAAVVKGLSNYLCRRRFEDYARRASAFRLVDEPKTVVERDGDKLLARIEAWVDSTQSGDRAELWDLPDDSPTWREVSPTNETRLGPRCPYFDRCFVTQARRRGQEADIVIVNHHLFFADLALRRAWPQAQLLPAYEAVIFDEAHQLEDIATDYFGHTVSTLRLLALDRDLQRGIVGNNLPDRLLATASRVQNRALVFFAATQKKLGRVERTTLDGNLWSGEVDAAALDLDTALEELESSLEGARGTAQQDGGELADSLLGRARRLRDDLALIGDGVSRRDPRFVYWAEQRGKTILLHASPIDVADIVRNFVLEATDAAVFTSATLATNGDFEFVRSRLGLESAIDQRVASPFDYATQSLLYLPTDLPEPQAADFTDRCAERMFDLVNITDGRAFLLFTSHRAMQRAYELLRPRLKQPLLLQGERSKHLLAEAFRQQIGSVLFATQSFWEGVDVPGEALSLVVIDKLPFEPPDDPVVVARSRRLEEQGHDPFANYQVPRAALSLAQGFGRLIRTRTDRGIVALLDRRATRRSYGKSVLSSLPPECPRTPSLEAVRAFWDTARVG